MEKAERVLGDRALWGRVGYTGAAHTAVRGTYPGIDAAALAYATEQDSGSYPTTDESALANLAPLIMAALNDVGFAWEAGPLTSWSN